MGVAENYVLLDLEPKEAQLYVALSSEREGLREGRKRRGGGMERERERPCVRPHYSGTH